MNEGTGVASTGRRMIRFGILPLVFLGLASLGCESTDTMAEGARAEVSFPETWRFSPDEAPVTGREGMVSTTDEHATDAGVEILRAGGNAIDAMVATHFALAVVNPSAGNIGGGGFMIYRDATGAREALNFRERAPLASTWDMFLDEDEELTDRSRVGHLAAGVPGSVMGMWEAHQRHGSLPWEDLLQPAIRLADGFTMHERLASSLAGAEDRLRTFEETERIFLPGGEVPEIGDVFRQPDLATTLRRIAEEGADGFYRGETADLIVEEMNRGGGIFTHEDLETYAANWQDPVVFEYRDHTIITMSPPSSGGATIAQIANILSQHDLRAVGFQTPDMAHLYAEAAKRAFADRNTYLADPAFVEVPFVEMASPEYGARRAEQIAMDRATPSEEVAPGLGPPPAEGPNTTHYSIVDRDGNAVSVTTTIRNGYGSRVTVTGAGFLLNNQMDDFAAKPGAPNQQGLVMGWANSVAPGKRPLSSMTPTIVESPQGNALFVTGSPGGGTIINTVMQTISNVVDFEMNVVQAVNAPRLHHQHLPDALRYEEGGLHPNTVADLEGRGHEITTTTSQGDVQGIMIMPDGSFEAWSDLRRGGTAVGF